MNLNYRSFLLSPLILSTNRINFFSDLYIYSYVTYIYNNFSYFYFKHMFFQLPIYLILGYINSILFFLLHYYLLEQSYIKIGLSSFPKKYKTFTVLRSPHIDKRSREQFHLIQYKYKVSFPLYLCTKRGFFFFYKVPFTGLKVHYKSKL